MRTITLFLMVVSILLGQSAPPPALESTGFVIDGRMPYVYIQFDHIGRRVPLDKEEVNVGLWLRLVNNCRIPIQALSFNPGTKDPGTGLQDEIVQFGGLVGSRRSDLGKSAQDRAKPPRGYSLDTGTRLTIAPGENVLFSVPVNHVSRRWYLQVRFDFALPSPVAASDPYSLVDFTLLGIPEADRGKLIETR